MATNYPGGLDSLSNPSAGSAQTSPSHAGQHTNANDAIEAIQGELGTDPSGSAATVRERLEGIEAGTRLAAGGVTSDKLEASIQGRIGNLLTPNQARGGDALASTEGFWPWICTLSYDPADPAGSIVGTKTAAMDGAIAISRRPMARPWIAHTFYIDGRKRTCTSVQPVVWFYDAGGSLISSYSLSSVVTSSAPFSAQMTMLPPAGAVEFSLDLIGTGAVAAQ